MGGDRPGAAPAAPADCPADAPRGGPPVRYRSIWVLRSRPSLIWAPTADPAEVPTTASASLRRRPASAKPTTSPDCHAIPTEPPPLNTSALVMGRFCPPVGTSRRRRQVLRGQSRPVEAQL